MIPGRYISESAPEKGQGGVLVVLGWLRAQHLKITYEASGDVLYRVTASLSATRI